MCVFISMILVGLLVQFSEITLLSPPLLFRCALIAITILVSAAIYIRELLT